jgi:outer membrane protein OmpA-like peptidoglycan-associated protein
VVTRFLAAFRPALRRSLMWPLLLLAGCAAAPLPLVDGQSGLAAPAPSARVSGPSHDRPATAWDALASQLQRDGAGRGLTVEPAQAGLPAVLRLALQQGVIFDEGSSVIRDDARAVLDQLVAPLLAQPNLVLRVVAPNDASRSREPWRARDRADAVRDYLANQGVAPSRFLPPLLAPGPVVEVVVQERGTPGN